MVAAVQFRSEKRRFDEAATRMDEPLPGLGSAKRYALALPR